MKVDPVGRRVRVVPGDRLLRQVCWLGMPTDRYGLKPSPGPNDVILVAVVRVVLVEDVATSNKVSCRRRWPHDERRSIIRAEIFWLADEIRSDEACCYRGRSVEVPQVNQSLNKDVFPCGVSHLRRVALGTGRPCPPQRPG